MRLPWLQVRKPPSILSAERGKKVKKYSVRRQTCILCIFFHFYGKLVCSIHTIWKPVGASFVVLVLGCNFLTFNCITVPKITVKMETSAKYLYKVYNYLYSKLESMFLIFFGQIRGTKIYSLTSVLRYAIYFISYSKYVITFSEKVQFSDSFYTKNMHFVQMKMKHFLIFISMKMKMKSLTQKFFFNLKFRVSRIF